MRGLGFDGFGSGACCSYRYGCRCDNGGVFGIDNGDRGRNESD